MAQVAQVGGVATIGEFKVLVRLATRALLAPDSKPAGWLKPRTVVKVLERAWLPSGRPCLRMPSGWAYEDSFTPNKEVAPSLSAPLPSSLPRAETYDAFGVFGNILPGSRSVFCSSSLVTRSQVYIEGPLTAAEVSLLPLVEPCSLCSGLICSAIIEATELHAANARDDVRRRRARRRSRPPRPARACLCGALPNATASARAGEAGEQVCDEGGEGSAPTPCVRACPCVVVAEARGQREQREKFARNAKFESARKAAVAQGWVTLDKVQRKGCGPTAIEVRSFTKCWGEAAAGRMAWKAELQDQKVGKDAFEAAELAGCIAIAEQNPLLAYREQLPFALRCVLQPPRALSDRGEFLMVRIPDGLYNRFNSRLLN